MSNVDWLELHSGQFLAEYSNDPNFAYWGIQSVHRLAEAGDELVATTTTESDVRIHASVRDDGSVAIMILNMNTTNRTLNITISGNTLSEDGVRYQTNGDTALSLTNLGNLGNLFSTSIAGRTLQVFVVPALPGDFNSDNVVDAADYVIWRKSNGSPASYNLWRAHFSQPPGSSSSASASAAVPEPATFLLLMFGAAGWCLRRSRAG